MTNYEFDLWKKAFEFPKVEEMGRISKQSFEVAINTCPTFSFLDSPDTDNLNAEKYTENMSNDESRTKIYHRHDQLHVNTAMQGFIETIQNLDIFQDITEDQEVMVIFLLISSFRMGKRVGMLYGGNVANSLIHEKHTVMDSKYEHEEMIKIYSSAAGSKKGSATRDAALAFMSELLKKNPDLKKYRLAKLTEADSKQYPEKYSRKSAIPWSTCLDHASIAKAEK